MSLVNPAHQYGWAGRIGIVVPPGSSTVEPEISSLLPAGVAAFVSRLPGIVAGDTGTGLRERLLGYDDALPDVASRLNSLDLDVAWLAHTASSYMAGFESDARIKAALDLSRARHVMTAADAIEEALGLLQAVRIAVVCPYPEWLTELAAAYWTSSGFAVRRVLRVEGPASLYEIAPEEVVEVVNEVATRDVDAIVLSGTGMPTFQALERLADHDVPVISSNMAFVWWVHRRFGSNDRQIASRSLKRLQAGARG